MSHWVCQKFVRTNFVNWSCKISKTNRKITWTKYLLKLKILWVQSQKNYILSKRIFPSDFFALTATWRTTITFSWFQISIEGQKWLIPEWTCWMAKNACNSSFAVYQTCGEIWWSFFFCCEASFHVQSRPLDFLLKIFLSGYFWFLNFSSLFLDRRHIYL